MPDNWKQELKYQVTSWSIAILGGYLDGGIRLLQAGVGHIKDDWHITFSVKDEKLRDEAHHVTLHSVANDKTIRTVKVRYLSIHSIVYLLYTNDFIFCIYYMPM
jgi:hypothetical protein